MAQLVVSVADCFEAFQTFKTIINYRAEQTYENVVTGHSYQKVEERNKSQTGSFKFNPELVCAVSRFVVYTFNSKRRKKKKRS